MLTRRTTKLKKQLSAKSAESKVTGISAKLKHDDDAKEQNTDAAEEVIIIPVNLKKPGRCSSESLRISVDRKKDILEMIPRTVKPFRVLQCSRCGFCSNDEETLSQHLKSIHDLNIIENEINSGSNLDRRLKCTECDYSSSNKHCVKQHYDLVHVADRKFKCPFCNYAGKRSHSLKEHLVVHSSTPPYQCTFCNASFRKKGHLTNHVRMHMRRAECSFCEAKFTTAQDLQEHIQAEHTVDVTYTCEVCAVATPDMESMHRHMQMHDNLPVYKCDGCSFSTSYIQWFAKHLECAEHCKQGAASTIVLMKCSECGFTTQDKQCLKSHMIQHIDKQDYQTGSSAEPDHCEEMYKCSDCPYSCAKAQIFVQHILSHKMHNELNSKSQTDCSSNSANVSKPEADKTASFTHDDKIGLYKCSLCGFVSEHQRSIKSHIWKHSGHKDIDYPMFQNGPLSVYDITPIGETVLLDNPKHKVKVISMEHKVRESENTQEHNTDSAEDISEQEVESALEGNRETAKPGKQFRHVLQCAWCSFYVSDVTLLENHLEDVHQIKEKIYLPEELKIDLGRVYEVKGDDNESLDMLVEQAEDNDCKNDEKLEVEARKDMVVFSKEESNIMFEIEISSQDAIEFQEDNAENVSYVAMVDQGDQEERNEDSLKRKLGDDSASSKRVCKDAVIATSDSVVVQQMPQVYNISYQESRANSPRASSPQLSRVSSRDSLDEDSEEPVPRQRCQSATSQEVVSLLSLLKKGPNYNPAYPPKMTDDKKSKDHSDMPEIAAGKKKKGICSSLLAVIEQLRERSKSDSDVEEGSQDTANQSSCGQTKRRRHSRNSVDEAALEDVPNVEHITEEEEGEIRVVYRCKLCHYSNLSPALIKTHMKLHKTKQPSECSLCDYIADSSEQLQDHMLQHCKVRIYQCKLCPSRFHYKSQLRAHMRAHDNGQFVCKFCSYETIDQGAFRTHTKTHMAQAACEVCGHFDSDPEAQVAHVKSHNQTENRSPIFKCLRCDKYFLSKEELLGHSHENDTSTEQLSTAKLKCTACEFTTTDMEDMKNHAQSHQNYPLKCELCDFEALSTRSLKSHMKRHANDQRFVQQPLEQYKCNLCGYVCHHLPSLKSHMWRHASDTNYSYQKTNDVINAAIDYDSVTIPTNLPLKEKSPTPANAEQAPKLVLHDQDCVPDNCLVTFRCCQCGYESIDKAMLHLHMKMHMDVIQKTMEIVPFNSHNSRNESIEST